MKVIKIIIRYRIDYYWDSVNNVGIVCLRVMGCCCVLVVVMVIVKNQNFNLKNNHKNKEKHSCVSFVLIISYYWGKEKQIIFQTIIIIVTKMEIDKSTSID